MHIRTDLPRAKAALDRIIIPEDTIDRIAQMMSPRSSLIISDEGPSSEISSGTEFVIVMSDEPQGGLAHRRPGPDVRQIRITRRSALLALAVRKFVFFLVAAPALLIKSAPRCVVVPHSPFTPGASFPPGDRMNRQALAPLIARSTNSSQRGGSDMDWSALHLFFRPDFGGPLGPSAASRDARSTIESADVAIS
jgi:hypothetical protein